MNYRLNIITLFLCLIFFPFQALCYPTAKITAKVIDEKGLPVIGANVHISFEVAKKGGWGTDNFGLEGLSDSNGIFGGQASASSRIGISVRKEGYYLSRQLYEFTSSSSLSSRWEPWNPIIEVVLKKKRNPIPMYDNHRTSYKIPKLNTPIGFDLEKEDWVAPYGKGVISDFIITFNVVDRAYSDYKCDFTLTFSNPHDGIQEFYFDNNDQSLFRWPFQAPVDGYTRKLYKHKSIALPTKDYQSNEKDNIHYLFRVRTKVDKKEKIIEANYGKLWGEFGFVPNGEITFRYFFNPDGTRNLEENPKRNLFLTKR